jgi:small subunit ribosomal protein S2
METMSGEAKEGIKEETATTAETLASKETMKATQEGYFTNFDFANVEMTLESMLKSGVHFGHMKSRRHPRMDEYIYTTRNNINIIDLQKSLEKLQEALKFLESVRKSGKRVLFVGTKKQTNDLVISLASRLKEPYVVERWIGGTFTNFKMICGRTKYLKESEEKMMRGEFKKYTKFEQAKKVEELEKLEKRMGGIKHMTELPGAVFIADVKESAITIEEARKLRIPTAGIVDTNTDPALIDYPIPANDDAVSSLRLILACVGKVLSSGSVTEASRE